MLGFLYLIIALAAGLTKGFCGKKVSIGTDCVSYGIWITVIRMFFCMALGLIIVLGTGEIFLLSVSITDLGICLLSAICMSIFNVSWLFSVKNQSYMFLSIFLMLGSIVTTICSALTFSEKVSKAQWSGMILLMGSVLVMSYYNNKIKGKMTAAGIVTLIICALASCFTDFSQKLYVHKSGKSVAVFQFYTYLIGFLILMAVGIVMSKYENKTITALKPYVKRMLSPIVIMSVCLYLNSMFKSLAAGILPAAQLYPILQGANLILSAVMAHFLMKESISKSGIVGIVIALAGIMMIA